MYLHAHMRVCARAPAGGVDNGWLLRREADGGAEIQQSGQRFIETNRLGELVEGLMDFLPQLHYAAL